MKQAQVPESELPRDGHLRQLLCFKNKKNVLLLGFCWIGFVSSSSPSLVWEASLEGPTEGSGFYRCVMASFSAGTLWLEWGSSRANVLCSSSFKLSNQGPRDSISNSIPSARLACSHPSLCTGRTLLCLWRCWACARYWYHQYSLLLLPAISGRCFS